jgi:biotin operon repressor
MPSKKQVVSATKRAQATKVTGSQQSHEHAKPATKKQQLIDLLSGEKLVTVEKMSKTLGWQPHTVRAAITGLRKAGFAVDSSRPPDGGGTCYRIVGQPQSTGACA